MLTGRMGIFRLCSEGIIQKCDVVEMQQSVLCWEGCSYRIPDTSFVFICFVYMCELSACVETPRNEGNFWLILYIFLCSLEV